MSVDDYVDKIYRLQTRLESYSKSVGFDLSKVLNARFKRLAAEVATGSTDSVKDVKKLEREFAEILQNTNASQTIIINKAMETGVISGYGAEQAGLALAGEVVSVKALNEQRVINKAWRHVIDANNISVESAWDKYIGTSSNRVKTIPRMAYSQGWGITKTVARLREVTQIDKRSATTMARTIVMSASNVARDDVSRQAGVESLIWKSTLDSRTTEYCAVRDGKVYKQGVGERPPGHFSCRSTMLSVPTDMSPTEFKKGLEVSTRGEDGKTVIKAYRTYGDFLKNQSKSFQREVIGKKRTELLRSGKITFDKMWTQDKNYISVEKLRKLYG